MRQVIGSNKIDDVLTEDRERIQIEAQQVLQGILDGYNAGLKVETVKLQDVDPPDQVSDAFKTGLTPVFNDIKNALPKLLESLPTVAKGLTDMFKGFTDALTSDGPSG